MCDCVDYEYEELAIKTEEKEPEKVAVPIQATRKRK